MAAPRLANVVVQLIAHFLQVAYRLRMARVSSQWLRAIDHAFAWEHAVPVIVARPAVNGGGGLAVRRMPVNLHWRVAEPHGYELDLLRRLRVQVVTTIGRTTDEAFIQHSWQQQRDAIQVTRQAIVNEVDKTMFQDVRQVSVVNCPQTTLAIMHSQSSV